jgi:hypothetical protein
VADCHLTGDLARAHHLYQKYNPDLQRKSLENRRQREEEWDAYVNKLKGYSRSDKNSKLPRDMVAATIQRTP